MVVSHVRCDRFRDLYILMLPILEYLIFSLKQYFPRKMIFAHAIVRAYICFLRESTIRSNSFKCLRDRLSKHLSGYPEHRENSRENGRVLNIFISFSNSAVHSERPLSPSVNGQRP